MTQEQHNKMVDALVNYDRKQATKKYYNRYAFAHYCANVENVREHMANGLTIRQAIIKCYLGSLCNVVLKSVGEKKMTADEVC